MNPTLEQLAKEYDDEMILTEYRSKTERAKELSKQYDEKNRIVQDQCMECERLSTIECQYH